MQQYEKLVVFRAASGWVLSVEGARTGLLMFDLREEAVRLGQAMARRRSMDIEIQPEDAPAARRSVALEALPA